MRRARCRVIRLGLRDAVKWGDSAPERFGRSFQPTHARTQAVGSLTHLIQRVRILNKEKLPGTTKHDRDELAEHLVSFVDQKKTIDGITTKILKSGVRATSMRREIGAYACA